MDVVMKKLIVSLSCLLLLTTNLGALDFMEILENNIGKEVIIFLDKDKKVIQFGGAGALYPLYIDQVEGNILIIKSKGSEVVIYIDIDKIAAIEIINLL